MNSRLIGVAALGLFFSVSVLAAQEAIERRKADLELLLKVLLRSSPPHAGRINAHDKTWEDWAKRTGELPPDFAGMPAQAFLPDPLISQESGQGIRITTKEQWERQRRWIRAQFEQWVYGRVPPKPGNLRVAKSTERREGNITIRDVLLEFGPGHRAKLNVQLMIPEGKGPFPVFLTNHSRNRSFWVYTAVSRGYIACYYRATDPSYGDPDDSDAFIEVYPEYDFSVLARWAWAAARAVDYLQTLPEVEKDQIGVAGHSRNGKQALLAAAFDDRIGAAVASSGLQGDALPHLYTSDAFVNERLQMVTGAVPQWFHPRLRFFSGREHKLPVDQNMLMALVAPRGLMLYSSHEESNANTFALEQVYRSARETYRFLQREENFRLHLREGDHGTEVGDVENFMDFFDAVFKRRSFPKQEIWVHGYDFETWKKKSGVVIDAAGFPERRPGEFLRDDSGRMLAGTAGWETRRTEMRGRLHWALGEPPPVLEPKPAPPRDPSARPLLGAAGSPALARSLVENSPPFRNPMELMSNRPQPGQVWQDRLAAGGMGMSSLTYGPGLRADVFYPVDAAGRRKPGKFPVAIWLHPYAYSVGWSAKFPWMPERAPTYLDQRPGLDLLVKRGFVVVAFDQIGFGSRAHEAKLFYDRYPQWSLMGKMVADTRAVVDAVSVLEDVNTQRIFLLGFSLGAKIGLVAAALDDRVYGVAAVGGFDALRLDRPEKGTEGLRHYSHLHGLLPKLGYFVGQEARLPFDYDEVLALAAPKKILVVSAEYDRFAPVADVRQEVAAARHVYQALGSESALELRTPRDFNRFHRELQVEVFDYLAQAAR